MPRPRRHLADPTISSKALSAALEAAPDVETTWRLLRSWRKRRGDLVDVASRSVRHWDQGLVFFVMESGRVHSIGAAFTNPSWPQNWADAAAIDWTLGLLSAETAGEPLERAVFILRGLQGAGRFSALHPAVDSFVQLLDGRANMTIRQMKVAGLLLGLNDLSVEVYNHIASAVSRSQVVNAGVGTNYYGEWTLLTEVLDHEHATEAWLDIFSRQVAPEYRAMWNSLLLHGQKWKHTAVGRLDIPVQPAIQRR